MRTILRDFWEGLKFWAVIAALVGVLVLFCWGIALLGEHGKLHDTLWVIVPAFIWYTGVWLRGGK